MGGGVGKGKIQYKKCESEKNKNTCRRRNLLTRLASSARVLSDLRLFSRPTKSTNGVEEEKEVNIFLLILLLPFNFFPATLHLGFRPVIKRR